MRSILVVVSLATTGAAQPAPLITGDIDCIGNVNIAGLTGMVSPPFQGSATPSLNQSVLNDATGNPKGSHRRFPDTLNFYATNADTFEFFPAPAACTTSNCGTHPSIAYAPAGALGTEWQEWLLFTPLECCHEDPCLVVRTVGNDWTEFYRGPDSSGYGEGYDDSTLTNPIFTAADWDSVDYLSDPDWFKTADGRMGMVFRATHQYPTPDTHVIKVALTADGLDWSDTTTILFGNSLDSAEDLMSPSIIRDTNGTFKIWCVEKNGPADNTVILFEAPKSDSGWTFVGTTDMKPHDTGNADIWHIDVLENGPDGYVALIYECDEDQVRGSGATQGDIYIATSPNGLTGWTTHRTPILRNSDGSGAWDGDHLYRPTAYWLERGRNPKIAMYYGAFQNDFSFGHRWHIGFSIVEFPVDTSEANLPTSGRIRYRHADSHPGSAACPGTKMSIGNPLQRR